MKSIGFIGTVALLFLVAITTPPAAAQNPGMVQNEGPNQNQMEPLNRQARQYWGGGGDWWNPPTWNPPGTLPWFRGGGGEGGTDIEFACGLLCPGDESGAFIPYRAPRPTKGKFIPIHG